MSKTIKQIAEEIGVSKSAIHQRRKKEPLKSSLQCFTESIDGKLYIDDKGVELIKQVFSIVSQKVTVNDCEALTDKREALTDKREALHGCFTPKNGKNEEVIHDLLYTLQSELDVKNKQIEALQKSVNDLTRALEHAHDSLSKSQSLHAGTIQTQLEAQSQNTLSESVEALSDRKSATENTGEKSPSKGFWGRLFQK